MKKILNEYRLACNAVVAEFCEKQDLVFEDWVDDIGGIALMHNDMYLHLSDIITDIRENHPKGKIIEWYDYQMEWHYKNKYINYSHYCKGARIDPITDNNKAPD